MPNDLSRRALLGLMAAAPVAAAVKPAAVAVEPAVVIGNEFVLSPAGSSDVCTFMLNGKTFVGRGGTGGAFFDRDAVRKLVDDLNANHDIPASDARGGGLPERSPGSPAFRNRAASEISWSCGWNEKSRRCLRYHCAKGAPCGGHKEPNHSILQHARAC